MLELKRRAGVHGDTGNRHEARIEINLPQILNRRRERDGRGTDGLFAFPIESQIEFDFSLIVVVLWNVPRRWNCSANSAHWLRCGLRRTDGLDDWWRRCD